MDNRTRPVVSFRTSRAQRHLIRALAEEKNLSVAEFLEELVSDRVATMVDDLLAKPEQERKHR